MSPDLLIAGLSYGAIYGLVALGIVIIYKGTRVINFAQGEFGTIAIYLAWVAIDKQHWGWPYWAGVLFALACAALIGLVVERTVVRPLLDSPRIAMLVATVGLTIVLGTLELKIWGPDPHVLPPPVTGRGISIGSALFTPTRLLIFAAAGVIGVGLFVFLKRTTFGLGVLAASEDPSGVRLTGLRLGRLSGFTWAAAAVVAGIGGLLLAPEIGIFHPFFMTIGLTKPLAAALVGGLTSLPGAFVGGLVVGVTESVFLDAFSGHPALVDAGIFGLILLVLLIRPQGLFGTVTTAGPTGIGARLAAGGRRRISPKTAIVVLAAAAVAVPMLSDYNAYVFAWMGAAALIGLGLNLVSGYAGQISLGHGAFMGTGAAVAALLSARADWPFELAVPAGALAGAAAGLLVGLPALRIRGMELAVSTLAFAVMFETLILPEIIGGRAALDAERPIFGSLSFTGNRAYAYLVIAAVAVAWLLDRNFAASRAGRAAFALRDDEQVAASFGINVAYHKLMAFVLSGLIAGLGGAMFAFLLQSVAAASFPYLLSLTFIAAVVVGGLRSRAGAVAGVAIFVAMPQIFEGLRLWGQLLGAGLVVVSVIRYPGGLAQMGRGLAERAARLVGRAEPKPRRRPTAAEEQAALNELRLLPHGAEAGPGAPVLEVEKLMVRFGGLHVLDGVTLAVPEGGLVGLIGPNGAGKTTAFNCISGFVRPQSGAVRFRGRDITRMAPHRRAGLGIARTFQLVGLAKTETVLTNVLIGQHLLFGYRDASALLGMPWVRGSERRAVRRAEALLDDLGLLEVADERVADLPHGTLKLVEVACAAAGVPQVLLLDEPTSGMGPREATQFGAQLVTLRERLSLTVLLIEHHVPLVLDVCDYVYAIDFGRPIAEGPPGEVARNPQVVEAYLGEAAREALARPAEIVLEPEPEPDREILLDEGREVVRKRGTKASTIKKAASTTKRSPKSKAVASGAKGKSRARRT